MNHKEKHEELRKGIIKDIISLVEQHEAIEMEVEFPEPVFYCNGFDEQDENQVIEKIDKEKAFIYHQGNCMGTEYLECLSTEMLLDIQEQVAASLEETKKFLGI
jgi:hypothetical protein